MLGRVASKQQMKAMVSVMRVWVAIMCFGDGTSVKKRKF